MNRQPACIFQGNEMGNYELACHATDGPPTAGPSGLSTANFVAIDGPGGPFMAP